MVEQEPSGESAVNRLIVLWTSQDREVAQNIVFMYTKNSKLNDWWDQVRLVVWGPSVKLLSVDEELQVELKELEEAGVELQACKACADRYGVSEKLKTLGIEVIYMGVPLTKYLRSHYSVITF